MKFLMVSTIQDHDTMPKEFSRWWTAEDSKQFSALTTALATVQCSRAITRNFVDGKFTLGENIGDLGGINAAYDGLQLYLKKMETRA
jgi:predicted metalloendopeptidase